MEMETESVVEVLKVLTPIFGIAFTIWKTSNNGTNKIVGAINAMREDIKSDHREQHDKLLEIKGSTDRVERKVYNGHK